MQDLRKKDSVAESIKSIMEKELSSKQKAIAKMSHPKDEIDAGDLAKLRAGHKPTKEEIDPEKTVTDTLSGREKKSSNTFLSKKVMFDVPGNVKEESEQLDELKKSTVKSYIAKKSEKLPGKDPKKDMKSMMSAHHRITGVKPTSEEVTQSSLKTLKQFKEEIEEPILDEMINEVLGKDATAGDYIHDFVHSDNPKFAGKSKAKRKEMALAAYYAKKRNEEVEVEESANPFSPDYKSQMKTKPGEKAGFTSKKISTGTVFSKKYKKDDEEEKKKVNEAKRPESDTVPFVTSESKPLKHAKELAKTSMKRIKTEMMGKTGTSE